MRNTTKNIIRIAGVAVSLGAAAWALRDRLLPSPEVHDEPPPRFRSAPQAVASEEPSSDDVMTIKGVGPASAAKLREAGVSTVAHLVASDAQELAEVTGLSPVTIEKWIEAGAATG